MLCWCAASLEARKSYRVFHAQDGWEGLTQARQRLPDLIITDLTMPEMDGFSVVEELKLDPARKTSGDRCQRKGYFGSRFETSEWPHRRALSKGSLPVRAFVNQVVEVIEQKGKTEEKK